MADRVDPQCGEIANPLPAPAAAESDDYEARHRVDRPVRLPRQLTARTQDFDDYGRSW